MDGSTLLHVAVGVSRKVLQPLLMHRLIDVNLKNNNGKCGAVVWPALGEPN
jgi:hypothetical protein